MESDELHDGFARPWKRGFRGRTAEQAVRVHEARGRGVYASRGLPRSRRSSETVPRGSITIAFWMCSLGVRFTVECVFDVFFEFLILKITLKTHSTVKRTSKQLIQNASVIDPFLNFFSRLSERHVVPPGRARPSLLCQDPRRGRLRLHPRLCHPQLRGGRHALPRNRLVLHGQTHQAEQPNRRLQRRHRAEDLEHSRAGSRGLHVHREERRDGGQDLLHHKDRHGRFVVKKDKSTFTLLSLEMDERARGLLSKQPGFDYCLDLFFLLYFSRHSAIFHTDLAE
jgi:hypothetical protein